MLLFQQSHRCFCRRCCSSRRLLLDVPIDLPTQTSPPFPPRFASASTALLRASATGLGFRQWPARRLRIMVAHRHHGVAQRIFLRRCACRRARARKRRPLALEHRSGVLGGEPGLGWRSPRCRPGPPRGGAGDVPAIATSHFSILAIAAACNARVTLIPGHARRCRGRPMRLQKRCVVVPPAVRAIEATPRHGVTPEFAQKSDDRFGLGGGENLVSQFCSPVFSCAVQGHRATTSTLATRTSSFATPSGGIRVDEADNVLHEDHHRDHDRHHPAWRHRRRRVGNSTDSGFAHAHVPVRLG